MITTLLKKLYLMVLLVNRTHVINIKLAGHTVEALLDTGSQVSTISQKYLSEVFPELEIIPIDNILTVVGASGQSLPYVGMVTAKVSLPGADVDELGLFLVMPETDFSRDVPVLIGTNILRPYKDTLQSKYGVRYIQKAPLPTPVQLAMRYITAEDRCNGNFGEMKCSTLEIVKPGETKVITASHRVATRTPMLSVNAAVVDTAASSPSGLSITPGIVSIKKGLNLYEVEVKNTTDDPIRILPGTTIGDVQQYNVYVPEHTDMSDEEFLKQFEFPDLDADHVIRAQQLLLKWKKLFSLHAMDLGHTDVVKHTIELTDTHPFKKEYVISHLV